MQSVRIPGVGLFLLSLLGFTAACGAAPVDTVTLNKIADEGFNHGEVLETAAYLADRIGGRLTNSPAMRTAESWTQGKLREWGLKNVRPEGFPFEAGGLNPPMCAWWRRGLWSCDRSRSPGRPRRMGR
jgi:hypothetical protein